MKSPWVGLAVRGWTTVALLSMITVTSASGQQNREDCRCVDVDGTEIENCTCFRAPNMEGLVSAFRVNASRPRLGISIEAGQGAGSDVRGALVTDVLAEGPADDAGIREGDLITSIDGESLFESIGAEAEADFDLDQSIPVQRLLAKARQLEEGQRVEIEYLRDGQAQTTMLEAEDLSDSWGDNVSVFAPTWNAERFRDQMRGLTDRVRAFDLQSDEMQALAEGRFRLRVNPPEAGEMRFYSRGDAPVVLGRRDGRSGGLDIVELNPTLGAYFGSEAGVLVVDVDRGSGLGLEGGDVVLSIGERAVDTPERFRRVLSSYGDEEDITFHILRNGDETTVTGRLRY